MAGGQPHDDPMTSGAHDPLPATGRHRKARHSDPYDVLAEAFPDLTERDIETLAVCVDTFRGQAARRLSLVAS